MNWFREIAGWLLVVASLYLFRVALQFVLDLDTPRVIEAGVTSFAALGILKAGTSLIRISTAARVYTSETVDQKS